MKAQHHAFSHQHYHEVTVDREPEVVFDYVTDPNRWHEWFAASPPGRIDIDAQHPGETFQLLTAFRLLPVFPAHLVHDLHCRISKSDRPYLWEVEADSTMAKAVTSYTLSRVDEGTVLKRQFCYSFKGYYRYVEPWLLRRRIRKQAELSLQRVKQRIEQQ